jgi:hypothetical protein
MTSDIDIYRAANILVKRYGEDAALEATQRADVMLERGDMDGYGAGCLLLTRSGHSWCHQAYSWKQDRSAAARYRDCA